ncbi:MAG: hypothetical protein DBP02_07685 [gamma proteobacterium symbiont of Ctena orbiculata]|nr:MAG: hypothetical protein DBP02_07685 [gamma proteobacterium symbiont of Ctena orbiculata]
MDVLPVLRMTRMVGDSGRTRYGKSNQGGAGFWILRKCFNQSCFVYHFFRTYVLVTLVYQYIIILFIVTNCCLQKINITKERSDLYLLYDRQLK